MQLIQPRSINFGGFPVKRLLPRRGIAGVGPWVFFDHMGPHTFSPGAGMDVIPHPHINLATVTYLFDGEILHRDSIGSIQAIRPGAVNLMVAGRGIAHSERTSPDLRAAGHRVEGLQLWHALPEEKEEREPSFHHYPADELPRLSEKGLELRLMIGSAYGLVSPVITFSKTLYAEFRLQPGARYPLAEASERALYLLRGSVLIDGNPLTAGVLALLSPEARIIEAEEETLCVLLGGDSLGKRYMWWNFVSSSKERIEKAQADWKAMRMGTVVDDRDEFAPLPEADNYSRMSD